MQGHWSKEHFVKVKEMGAKLVRIPVHPVAWRERTPAEYLKLLDQAVGWCTELEMYVILDWHTIGNLETEVFQDPMYETTKQETYNFWRTMARHFAGHNTVAFFELFNEPTTYRSSSARSPGATGRKLWKSEITMIRAYNPQAIPLVAGFDWAYDLTPCVLDPIAAEGIALYVHPYANKRPQPWEPKWEEDFGFAAAKYPVIATEFGGFARPPADEGQPPRRVRRSGQSQADLWPGDHQVSRRQRHQLDRLVLRSGMGADADQELGLRAESIGRIRQGGHAWRDQIKQMAARRGSGQTPPARSATRTAPFTEVPGCQWDTLKPL